MGYTTDKSLTLHNLFCRYARFNGKSLEEANLAWRSFRESTSYATEADRRLAAKQYFDRNETVHGDDSRHAVNESAGPTLQQEKVFPLIARHILVESYRQNGFIRHDSIVDLLLADEEAAPIIEYAIGTSSLPDSRAVASNMVAWFSAQITSGSNIWTPMFIRQRLAGKWAYRYNEKELHGTDGDAEMSALEGEPRLMIHFHRERDSHIAQAKRDAVIASSGRLVCEACGISATVKYPGLNGEICEVHHRLPLAESCGNVETRLEDLAVLCANCHRAIHRGSPMPGVEEFRNMFFLEAL